MPKPLIIQHIIMSLLIWSKYFPCVVAKKIELIIIRTLRLLLKNYLLIFLGHILGRILLHSKIGIGRQVCRHHALVIKKNNLVPCPWYRNKKEILSITNVEFKPFQCISIKIVIKSQPVRIKLKNTLEISNSYPIDKAIREV